jgi:hypothetical protein
LANKRRHQLTGVLFQIENMSVSPFFCFFFAVAAAVAVAQPEQGWEIKIRSVDVREYNHNAFGNLFLK